MLMTPYRPRTLRTHHFVPALSLPAYQQKTPQEQRGWLIKRLHYLRIGDFEIFPLLDGEEPEQAISRIMARLYRAPHWCWEWSSSVKRDCVAVRKGKLRPLLLPHTCPLHQHPGAGQ